MITCPASGTFIVTLSLEHRLSMLASSGLRVPERYSREMLLINQSFCDLMREAVQPHALRIINMADLTDLLNEKVLELIRKNRTKVILSTCADMYGRVGYKTLAVNRLYDPNGVCIGYGPRPGFPSIDVQLNAIAKHLSERPIILVEDGVFTGNTLKFVLDKLASRGYSVSDVVIGFCRLDAVEALKKGLNGRVKTVLKIENVIDWLSFPDIFPFVPHSGRVIGYRSDKDAGELAAMTSEGVSYSHPYIAPFGMPCEWAGLPQEAADRISLFGLRQSIGLFELLERLNDRHIIVRDMIRDPRVSVPHQINKLEAPAHPETRVLDYLRKVLYVFENK